MLTMIMNMVTTAEMMAMDDDGVMWMVMMMMAILMMVSMIGLMVMYGDENDDEVGAGDY